MTQTIDRNVYGTREVNGLVDGQAYHAETITETLEWNDPDLVVVTRLRLLSDPGFPLWDVSYCHGYNTKREKVNVSLPFSQLPKRDMKGAIIRYAKKDGVYAKGLGILDNISTLC
jgi:undecaprenyl pyrophosphate synthase